MKCAGLRLELRFLGLLTCLSLAHTVYGQIQVTSTNPSAAPQGTVNLNVTVNGNGFARGAQAQFFITGTTDPGGVVVNATTFNNKRSLTANVTISGTATIANFDVQVTSAGRTGKGTEMFAVTPKGTPIGCSTSGTPSGATLQAMLNPVQSNGAALITTLRLGNAIRVRPLDLNGDNIVDTLVAFVTSGVTSSSTPGTYLFFLDPATGTPQAHNPVNTLDTTWRNPMPLLSGFRANQAAVGDVNGDGIPDFVQAGCCSTPYLFVGRVSSASANPAYHPTWTAYSISPPGSTAVALGDVDGIGHDEVVFGGAGAVFIYKYTSGAVSYVRQIQDPTGASKTGFGGAVAIGNVAGTGNDLVVGASTATTNGLVYVFPHIAQQSAYFTLTGPGPSFGRNLGIADVNLDGIPDLLVITGTQGGSSAQALLYAGPVAPAQNYTNQLLPGESNGWGNPNIDVADMTINSAARGAVAIGAPQTSTCGSIQGGIGALNLYTSPFTSSETPNYVFETPYPLNSSQYQFGYGVGIAPGYPLIVIGEHFRDVGTTLQAGQVYVYKLGN